MRRLAHESTSRSLKWGGSFTLRGRWWHGSVGVKFFGPFAKVTWPISGFPRLRSRAARLAPRPKAHRWKKWTLSRVHSKFGQNSMCGLLVAEVTWHNTGLGVRVLLGVAITRLPQGQTRLDGSNGHWAVHTRSLNRILCVDCPWQTMPTREKSVVDLDWGGGGGNSYRRRRRR